MSDLRLLLRWISVEFRLGYRLLDREIIDENENRSDRHDGIDAVVLDPPRRVTTRGEKTLFFSWEIQYLH